MVAHVTAVLRTCDETNVRYARIHVRDAKGVRERLITKEIIIGTHAPRAVGLTIGLPPPHLHLLFGSDAREPHMPMACLRDKPPKASCRSFPSILIDPESEMMKFYPRESHSLHSDNRHEK